MTHATAPSRATILRHPLRIFLGASAMTVLVSLAAADWLQASVLPTLGVPARLTLVAAVVLGLLCTGALAGLGLSWRRGQFGSAPMPPVEAVRQVREVVPCLTQMNDLLSSALQDSEHSAQSLIARMGSIHQMSSEQMERITATRASGKVLDDVVKDKVMVDSQLGSILTLFVETQEAEAQANLDRVKRLQSVKDLTSMVDEIANVARQTNFLSINAAIEAARAGESGRSFAVLAAEIRQLSQQTTKVAVDITAKIESVTMGIDQELSAAVEGSGPRNSTRNMRQVVDDVAAMQARFVQSMDDLQLNQVSASILEGHRELERQLTEALGQMQGQDLLRQRIESVQRSLTGLDDLLLGMADQLHDQPWAPDTMEALRERLQVQVRNDLAPHDRLRMAPDEQDNESGPRIQLF